MLKVILLSVFVPLCLAATTPATNDIVSVLAARTSESILVDLVKTAGLADVLSQGGPFTVFAPYDYAFSRLGNDTLTALKKDPNTLAETLKYHVVNGIYKLKDLHVNELQLDSLAGTKIRINYYFTARRHVTAEGSRIIRSDIMASNGVIHIVHDVMMPAAGSIVDVLTADGNFSTLVAAAKAAGLVEALQQGPFTLMAPSNTAFAALGDKVDKLLANPDLLKKVLLYHVIPGTIYKDGLHSGSLHTLEEADRERISASFFGTTVHVDGTTSVIKPDISATNGVVHMINHVLIPSSLRTQIMNL
ncbi:transforming growth factor-beta-induced protein [Mytilus galloprovincialis]|uniref:Transforming growth factor-beta-induced protein n=1 Tax=Mytilus galloprovincialis TaxID=29158 RepID=A0A8B6E380_MYTGA|nr:transforming growth factor-beta-induced protein [Mytilus galloprovincialis]